MFKQHLSLHGTYKIRVFNKDGSLKEDFSVPNFITPTGLEYPKYVSFADCFRFISLGVGTTANSNVGAGTTGLASPSIYQYIGGSEDNGYDLRGCGYIETASGVRLARSWRVPATDGTYFPSNFTFQEVMVSPGSPTFTEEYDLLLKYPNIASYKSAFSRILKTISVETNNYLVATYELDIGVNTGFNYFSVPITRSAVGHVQNWNGTLSGVYSIVHHGLHLVRGYDTSALPGNVDPNFTETHYGDSFNGPLGGPLEPSCLNNNYKMYVSTDKTQFLADSVTGGGMNTGLYKPYNPNGKLLPSGCLGYHAQPVNETQMGDKILDGTAYWFINIRRADGNYFPKETDYREFGTAAEAGINPILYKEDDTFASPFVASSLTSRIRYRELNGEIQGNTVGGNDIDGQPIRSVVLAYADTRLRANSQALVFMDAIFGDKTDGMNSRNTGNFTFFVAGDPNDPTHFNYLDGNNNLQLKFRISWSSPCEAGMASCTNP